MWSGQTCNNATSNALRCSLRHKNAALIRLTIVRRAREWTKLELRIVKNYIIIIREYYRKRIKGGVLLWEI